MTSKGEEDVASMTVMMSWVMVHTHHLLAADLPDPSLIVRDPGCPSCPWDTLQGLQGSIASACAYWNPKLRQTEAECKGCRGSSLRLV